MKKKCLRLIALALACVMLTGCTELSSFVEAVDNAVEDQALEVPRYADMAYSRPDMQALEDILDQACTDAAGDQVLPIIERIWEFYDAYDWFYTNYSLADIRYSCDLTDTYWEAEYNFCAENSARVDAMLEELYYALAKSPCLDLLESEMYFGEGYFDSYQGENNWDEEFVALMEEEAALVSRYYELSGQAADYETGSEAYYDACYEDMAQVLVDLIELRHEIAAYWGYRDYNQFATDFYHYRDYSVEEGRAYLKMIAEELVELYRQVNQSGLWDSVYSYATEEDTYAYVKEMAERMGGTVWEAFLVMEQGGLYDIGYSENKYNASYEIYLTSYQVPFVFMNPSLTNYDHLVFAHEFGHFCNDYASNCSYAGVDVLEFFSQGMEYLSLCYGETDPQLIKMKLADSLCIYMEQAAFASFEMGMYNIPEENLSVEALAELYQQVALEYGFETVDYDPREFITITHFYTNPLYIISYVVSNDAAMQLYQLEQEYKGEGLKVFEENLTTEEYFFLSFLESAGLENPLTRERIQAVRQTFEEVLG